MLRLPGMRSVALQTVGGLRRCVHPLALLKTLGEIAVTGRAELEPFCCQRCWRSRAGGGLMAGRAIAVDEWCMGEWIEQRLLLRDVRIVTARAIGLRQGIVAMRFLNRLGIELVAA